ncbi:DUF4861 domain-containing protein [Flavihumibacter stibioxidans]|nr:DUF4861 domain-containing protein [Flavihumibacter stibioxidans]
MQKPVLELENPVGTERQDELIVLSRQSLAKKLGNIPSGKFVQLNADGQPILIQYDDMDGDGNWDEMAFLYSFLPSQKKSFQLQLSDAPAAIKAVVRANARHRRKNADNSFGPDLAADSIPAGQPATDFSKQPLPPFLTEGPAWENDKVGFRLYFDVRNGKDIWGKTTADMVLDTVGMSPASNYHQQAGWGMDVLKVGPSLGAGALALYVPGMNGKDSLVRVGGRHIEKVSYKKVVDGPVRAIINLTYHNWKIAENMPPLQLTETISIWGGQYFYESTVIIRGAPADAKLVTGVVNLHHAEQQNFESGGVKGLYTWHNQSENKDNLGMAILAASSVVEKFSDASGVHSDIKNSYLAVMNTNASSPVGFRFFAGWEKSSPMFKSAEGFRNFLEHQANLYQHPILIR